MILHTLEVVALALLLCAAGAAACLVLARRASGRLAQTMLRWIAVMLGLAAIVPAALVAWAVGH